jgi:prolyl oligopeptidase
MPAPVTRTDDVVDDYFGTKVADPYRWLEDGDSPEVKAWTEQQNEATRAVLDAIGGRDALRERIRALLSIGTLSPPTVRRTRASDRRYFHVRREGAQKQPVLYVRDGVGGADRALVDPAAMSSTATTALDWWFPSSDGSLLAFGLSDDGSEQSTLVVRDVATGKDLADRIPYTKHASIAWMPDGIRFFYTRFPEPGTVPPGDENYSCRVYEHALGTDWRKDRLVFGAGRAKTELFSVAASPDGRWLVVVIDEGYDRSEVLLADLSSSGELAWVEVAVRTHARFEPIPHNDRLYILTDDGAPRFRLYAVDYDKVGRDDWKELIPEGPDVLSSVAVIGKDIVATYLHQAATRVERFALDGRSLGDLPLPALGTSLVSGAWNGDEAFVQFTSYVVPADVWKVDLLTGKIVSWDRVGTDFTPPKVLVSRMFATSKDGTRIPMFVVESDATQRDGTRPAVLWGYGGFNLSATPAFSASALLTVQRGGVWVMANLRGGGEFGEEWHKAGMLGNKQNVFDDFCACAETLIAEKVASPTRIAAMGGSNGGLLVAAAVTQRPDLFCAGLSMVPLTDMLRYHRFRIARFWEAEYGSSEDPEQFAWLYAYSPYHRAEDGTHYPAMLFTTAESDSRVDPMHARKMAARMQRAQAAPHPILLRVEKNAGHGAGKPTTKVVEELTDALSFLFAQLGLPC